LSPFLLHFFSPELISLLVHSHCTVRINPLHLFNGYSRQTSTVVTFPIITDNLPGTHTQRHMPGTPVNPAGAEVLIYPSIYIRFARLYQPMHSVPIKTRESRSIKETCSARMATPNIDRHISSSEETILNPAEPVSY